MLRTRRPRMSLVERLRNQTKVLRAEWNRTAAKNLLELVFRDLPTTLSLRERVFRFAEIDETFFQFGRVDIRLGKQAGILNRSRRGNRQQLGPTEVVLRVEIGVPMANRKESQILIGRH